RTLCISEVNVMSTVVGTGNVIGKYTRDVATFHLIATTIANNLSTLQKPGVLFARPGYEEVGGRVTSKPAIVVTVANKRHVPTSIDGFRVDVRQASLVERMRGEDPDRYATLLATGRSEYEAAPFDGEWIVNRNRLASEEAVTTSAARPTKPHLNYTAPHVPLN